MSNGGQRGGMPPPDWERYAVQSRSGAAPVGDPRRWGATITVAVPAVFTETVTEQFLRVQTVDGYSRSWSLIGTLQLPSTVWAAAATLGSLLEVTQGVGQASIVQTITLAIGGTANSGLCNTQNISNGGPYFPTFSGPGNTLETRPFAAIGALVGSSISIRARFVGFAPFTGLPCQPVLSAILCPYAAGQGL